MHSSDLLKLERDEDEDYLLDNLNMKIYLNYIVIVLTLAKPFTSQAQ